MPETEISKLKLENNNLKQEIESLKLRLARQIEHIKKVEHNSKVLSDYFKFYKENLIKQENKKKIQDKEKVKLDIRKKFRR